MFPIAGAVGEVWGCGAAVCYMRGVLCVQCSQLRPLAAGLENGVSKAETHGAAKGCFGYFRHGYNDRVGDVFIEFCGVGFRNMAYVTGIFDYGELHAQADAQERYVVFTSPFDGADHTLGSSQAEAAGNEDTLRDAEFVPCFVKVGRRGDAYGFFEVRGVNPNEVQLSGAGHSGVF